MPGTTTKLNGVDVDRLEETIAAIDADPKLARFEFRAKTEWEGGARSRTTVKEFHGAGRTDTSREQPLEMVGDEPPLLLGENRAPNAVETVLHALTSCLTVGFVYNAAARGIEVRSLDFDIDGELDLRPFLGLGDGEPAGYDEIRVRYRVDADAPKERIDELCAHVQRTSPVLDVISRPVPVSVSREA